MDLCAQLALWLERIHKLDERASTFDGGLPARWGP